MAGIQHERRPRLSHREHDRMVEPARELSEEELFRIMDAAFPDHFAEGGNITGRAGDLDPVVERLHISAHGSSAGTAGHSKFGKIQFRTRFHIVDGTHSIPDPEPGEIPADQP